MTERGYFAVWDDGSTTGPFLDGHECEQYAREASTWGSGPVTVSYRERLVSAWTPVPAPTDRSET